MISSCLNKCIERANKVTMMEQSHDNDWLYILLCDFQLRTKKHSRPSLVLTSL